MNIVILGSGNIAHYLCTQLKPLQDFQIVQLYSRNEKTLAQLAHEFDIPSTQEVSHIIENADVYIFAVDDQSIHDVSKELNLNRPLCIHCAGAQPLDILKDASARQAVIWPIYSITPQAEYLSSIPLVTECSDPGDQALVAKISGHLSTCVYELDYAQRKYLHMNAVFVNNFGNHLMSIAQTICAEQNIDFDILHPIIEQTAQRIQLQSPKLSQTGPAKRGDKITMDKHVNMLQSHESWAKVYEIMSQSIQEMYPENNH